MDYEKTGRLIRRKRKALGLTQLQLSEAVLVTPQAVSLWEKGNRFPDAAAQIMLFQVLGLNPVELLTGLEMYDEELKQGIAAHMRRIDEKAFVAGSAIDEDGNEEYLNLSSYMLAMPGRYGRPSDTWIPYTDFYNVAPVPEREEKHALTASPYDPSMVYLNRHHAILVIPVEILEKMGNPLFFNIIQNKDAGWIGFQFPEEPDQGEIDIPPAVYSGEWLGVRVLGGEFGRALCKEMGIRRGKDLISVEPVLLGSQNAVVLPLDRAKRVHVDMDDSRFLLPMWQYEEIWAEDEDPEGEESSQDETLEAYPEI